MCLIAALAVSTAACDWIGGDEITDPPAEPAGVAMPPITAQETSRCYDDAKVAAVQEIADPRMSRDVLVLVDQTTLFPDRVREQTLEQVARLAAPGTRLSIGVFSSYTGTDHARIAFESFIEPAVSESRRSGAPMQPLRRLDACLESRRQAEGDRLSATLAALLADSRESMQRSDILSSLKDYSARLRSTQLEETMLVVVSDMLENSSVISFYGNGAMRTIDPAEELTRVEENGLLSDLPGSRVYVIGLGLVPGADAEHYRTVPEIRALERFWTDYFERSGARSTKVGKPLLVEPIG